jgi:(R,R)-butanediol dehydrogenase / meso-butanediol dehydrogenase / diacetyl reductase
MRAGVFQGIRRIELADVDEPELAPTGVIVEVRACGICGSDLHGFTAGMFNEPGQIMGHEFAGDVIAVGSAVDGVSIGDRVSAMPLLPCWECPACQAGEIQRCLRAFAPGIGVGLPGAFAERVHVPDVRMGTTVFLLPDSLSYQDGALLEPLAVAIHAVERAGVQPSEVVAVVGLGPIGQLVGRVLLARGVRTVVGIELSPERRARAETAGMLVADGSEGLAGAVAAVLGPDAVVSAVIETSGAPSLPQQAVDLVAKGGAVTIVALYEKQASIDISAFAVPEVTVRGCLAYRAEDFAEAVRLIASGVVQAHEIVTGHTDLTGLQSAFEQLSQGAGAIKILVDPGLA